MPSRPFDGFCRLLSSVVGDDVDNDDRYAALAEWTGDDWELAIELASNHFVLPSIAGRLSVDQAGAALDPDLKTFFKGIHNGNIRRNEVFLRQIERFCRLANGLGIRPILLKGAAHLADDIYGDQGARFLSDIDVLVDRTDREKLLLAMKDQGYATRLRGKQEAAFWHEHHHAPPMQDPDDRLIVEVHSDTLREGGGTLDLDMPALAARACEKRLNDACFSLPSIEDRLVHCIAHNQLGHNERFTGSIEMRDALDLHFLTTRGSCSDEQWRHVLQRFEQAGHGNMAIGFLNALKTMVPAAALGPCPAGSAGARRRRDHYLRRYQRSRLKDPTLYSGLMAREWHRLLAFKTYRQQLWQNIGDIDYWRVRWRNLLQIIWRM